MFNILDIAIILIIILGGIFGFYRGFIRQTVMTIGLILVLLLSYTLKNSISFFMYQHFPFFNFDMIFKNASVLNVLVYEVLAFLTCFSILEIIFVISVKLSTILEKLIKLTAVLKIPSKVFGAILGMVEYYLLIFVVLFIFSIPTLKISNSPMIKTSALKPIILTNTLMISSVTDNIYDTFNEIGELIDKKDKMSSKEFDCKSLKIMMKKKFLTKKSAEYLYRTGKIKTTCGIK